VKTLTPISRMEDSSFKELLDSVASAGLLGTKYVFS
jgi:hypothetical protein